MISLSAVAGLLTVPPESDAAILAACRLEACSTGERGSEAAHGGQAVAVHPRRASSNTFASCRSFVSKPSVNQP